MLPRPFLTPLRPGLAAARAAVQGATSSSDAWSRLLHAGVLPADWRTDPRRFVHDPMDGDFRCPAPTRDPSFAPREAWPQTLEQCALIASDVDGVLAAEAAALELGRRLSPGEPPLCDRVVWWLIPRARFGRASSDTRAGVIYAPLMVLVRLQEAAPACDIPGFGHAEELVQVWRDTPSMVGTPNPFEPLALIEAAGYSALEYVGGTGRAAGAIVLVAPDG